jgi:phosphoglucosamine mutase
MFGTSGIRRVFQNYSESDLMFTPQMALEVGLALGTYLNGKANVIIGKDIRTSALPIEYALISGLVSTGCTVKTLGIVTTPTLAMSLRFLNAEAGVMITASHNTPEYIGLKIWNRSGMGYTPEQEIEIERIYNEKAFINIEWDEVGKVTHIDEINETHILDITNRITFDGSDLNVILDPGNGAGCDIVPRLLSAYDINLITLNAQMDGKFPGRNSEPSKENLSQVSKFIKTSDRETIGIALDGDADRVIFLNEDGEVVDPIRLLTLIAKDYLKRYKGTRIPEENLSVVTAVGDIKVAIAIKEHGGFVGGETSGTYIWPSSHLGPDSIVTIAKVLRMIVETGKPLRDLLKEIPEYPFCETKYRLKKDIPFKEDINKKIIEEMKETLDSLGKKITNINKMDGVRFDYNDGWILIRRSGTSPYLRLTGESSVNLEASQEMNKLTKEKMEKLNLI